MTTFRNQLNNKAMTDTHNFQPLEDYDNPKSPYYEDPNEVPFIRSKKKIHGQVTKGEVFIQSGKDNLDKQFVKLPTSKSNF